jgi:predicted dehydrogenase
MRVAIIGCGFIGQKRARALPGGKVVACFDVVPSRMKALAEETGALPLESWEETVSRPDVDAVIISTTHDALPRVGLTAIENGKHVLIEKPAARRAVELEPLIEAADRRGVRARVGFNHRFHPALQKARELVDSGDLGPLMYVRARYGHGGRLGYDKEWRARPEVSGGGELIDQGMHIIDLARWFLGDFVDVRGFAETYFWDMPVEDNGFMLLRTAKGQVAQLHASWTEWKNLFSFEIFGRVGKIEINGLGGSYGLEKLTFYRMLPQMGPPETAVWEFPQKDESWALEFSEFVQDVKLGRQSGAGLVDAAAALRVVEAAIKSSSSRS